MTSQFQLVWAPLILAALLLALGIWVLAWRKQKLIDSSSRIQGNLSILVLGSSLLILSGFSLFLGLFFLISG